MYLLAGFKIFSLALVFMFRTCLGMFLCLRFVELLESVEFIIFIKFQQHFQSFFCHSFSVFFWDFSYHFTGPQIVAVLFIFSLFIFDQFYFENFLLLYLHKAMVFPVVTYGCESWTVKKDECRRFDAFELWCWRRLLRVPWTARRSNQSILKEVSPEYSLEGLMLKLKFQYFGQLMWKDHDAGKNWGQEEKGATEDKMAGWHQWLDRHESVWVGNEQIQGDSEEQGRLTRCSS